MKVLINIFFKNRYEFTLFRVVSLIRGTKYLKTGVKHEPSESSGGYCLL